ncbi:hypothetical protein QTO34_016764 [Cnephaeus nilssonii]|uniref:Uncharacterized protein n=1 Tax=Cnephaeus nilssonii TaxID=3371016 RepID=A0AA40I2V0_CNENI|nr:hypothetical protein QTO34_016764 [Eptesicus nilssonii]
MEPNRTWSPVTRQPHSITALPTHSDRDLGEDPMFSCCLPVSRGRCLTEAAMRVCLVVAAAGSGPGLSTKDACGPFPGGGTQRSILSPGGESHFPWVDVCVDIGLDLIWDQKVQWAEAAVTRARLESSQSAEITVIAEPNPAKERPKQVKEELQLVHEDPRPTPSREGPVSHTTEGQRRPEVRVATWGSGEPGPMGAGRRTPPPEPHRPHQPPTSKPLSPNRQKALFNSVLQCCACGNRTRPEDLEPKEAEPKGEKLGRWGWNGGEVPVSLWGGIVARHTGSPPEPGQEQRLAQTTRLLDFGREGVLW